jgi:hypothetical protein
MILFFLDRIELILKTRVGFEGKAACDEKAEHTRQYVSIFHHAPTPPSDSRQAF